MSLRPKTARRLLLVAILLVLGAGSAFGFFVVRRWQNDRMDAVHRAEGLTAADEDRHVDALTSLRRYLQRHQRDPEAILAYARSRVHVEDRDGNHLRDAIDKYERLLDLTPDDDLARSELLDLYLRVGYWKEAAESAQRLRPRELSQTTPRDIPVLIKEATALLGARDFSTRLPSLLARVHDLDALNVHAHLAYLDLLAETNRRELGVPHAERLLALSPDDPRTKLVMAYAILMQPGSDGQSRAASLLAAAAGLDFATGERTAEPGYSDADLAGRVALGLDLAGRPDLALRAMEHDAARLRDPMLSRLALRRLWQAGRVADVVDASIRFFPDEARAETEALAFRAASLFVLGRAEEARRLIDTIDSRGHDYRAAPWAAVLRLNDPASNAAPPERLAVLESAAKAHPLEPIFPSMLADQLASLGRREEAWDRWRAAIRAPLGASWAAPRLAMGQSLLSAGRIAEAFPIINDARRAAPQALVVNVVWVEATTALLTQGLSSPLLPPEALQVAEVLDADLAQRPQDDAVRSLRERLLPCRVELAISASRLDLAADFIRAALDDSAGLTAGTLQRLASASEAATLGLEDACLARLRHLHGEVPGVVLSHAIDLAEQAGPEAGLAHLRDASARGGDTPEWRVALARYMELTGHHGARDAWVALGDSNIGDLAIQRLILESDAVASDREFVEKTIARFKALTGKETGLEPGIVRLARARAQLRSGSSRDRTEAIAALNVVVSEDPRQTDARLLLARALSTGDPARGVPADVPGAIRHYEEIIARTPGRARISLELARLYQTRREFARSREVLESVANDPRVEEGVRLAAARALVAQGDGAIAVLAIEPIVAERGDHVDDDVLLALGQGYLSLRRDADAARIFDRLAARPLSSPIVAFATAESLASRGDYDAGLTIIHALDPELVGPGVKEGLEARLARQFRDVDDAVAVYERAIAVAPARFETWRGYVDLMLREGRTDDAAAIADRALAAVGETPDVAMMIAQTRSTGDLGDLNEVLRILESQAANPDARRLAGLLRDARDRGELDNPKGLADFAARAPDALPIQLLSIRRLQELGDHAGAASIATRAMGIFPRQSEPARLASISYAAIGNHAELLRAAEAWRARAFPRPPEADLAVAQAALGLGQPERALAELEPQLAEAKANPEQGHSLGVLNIAARALLALNREPECRDLLTPLLATSPSVRVQVWIPLALEGARSAEAALAWLDAARVHSSEASEERLVLANAFLSLAPRYHANALAILDRAKSVLEAYLATDGPSPGVAHEILGVTLHTRGDIAGAERCYREAVRLDPTRADAMNNLAFLLLDRPDALDESLALARAAVAAAEPPTPARLDTLALALRRKGERLDAADDPLAASFFTESAAAYRRAIARGAADIQTLAQHALACELAAEWDEAIRAYERLLLAPGIGSEVSASLQNNLAYVLVRPERRPNPVEIERARTLARGALAITERAAYWDTLGEVELASGRLDEAEKSFRRAIELDALSISARIGLGETLLRQGSGGAEQALRVVEDLSRLIESGSGLSPSSKRRFESFRERARNTR